VVAVSLGEITGLLDADAYTQIAEEH
jgi:hypothetical protein